MEALGAGFAASPLAALLRQEGALERLLAVGLATVDLERAANALRPLRFEAAPAETALGAHASRAAWPDGTSLLLLEPAREGRLAAFLARHGEGPAVAYVAGPASDPGARALPAFETALGRPARLLRPHGSGGPFLLVVDPRAGAP